MASMAKTKGANAEREVCALLQPVVNKSYRAAGVEEAMIPRVVRNLLQSRQGGYDVSGVEWAAIEIKRQETLNVAKWWEQTKKSAGPNQEPILIYRQNGRKWRIMMFGYIPAGNRKVRCPVEVSWDIFIVWFETKLNEELKNEKA